MVIMKVVLAQPRGFCAGVERAIDIVEKALETYGPPVYVRHEIVHNRHVVDSLRAKGAVFVEELDEVPEAAIRTETGSGADGLNFPCNIECLLCLPELRHCTTTLSI